jgi:ankyrin repeat protein
MNEAICQNDLAAISLLISNGGIDVSGSLSPLHYATILGRLEIMALLLDAGADIDAVDDDGQSACFFAICREQTDALRFLVARGANLRARNGSLLDAAAGHENDRIAIILLDAGVSLENLEHNGLMELMARTRSIPLLKRLLARNVDVSALRDPSGGTILHGFVCRDINLEYGFEYNVEFVRALVQLGKVDVNAANHNGKTALHYVAMEGRLDFVPVLVQLGADVDHQDATGETALLSGWNGPCTQLLRAFNTDVTLATVDGKTACHFAADVSFYADGTFDDVRLRNVVALGGDLDQPDNRGVTPRMIAVRWGRRLPTADEIDSARRCIAKNRFNLVRKRALEICVGLQSLRLNALQSCEIMAHSFGALGSAIAFHQWWAIAIIVKHFRGRRQHESTNNDDR